MTHNKDTAAARGTQTFRPIRRLAIPGLAIALVVLSTGPAAGADTPPDPHLARIRALVSELGPQTPAGAWAPAPAPAACAGAGQAGEGGEGGGPLSSVLRDAEARVAATRHTSDDGMPRPVLSVVAPVERADHAGSTRSPTDPPVASILDDLAAAPAPEHRSGGDAGTAPAATEGLIHVHMRPIRVMCDGVPAAFGLRVTSELREAIGQSHRYALAPMPDVGDVEELAPCHPTGGEPGRRCVGITAEIVRRAEFGPNQVLEVSEKRVNLYYDHRRYEVGIVVRVIDLGSGEVMASTFLGDLIRSKDFRLSHTSTHLPYAIDPPSELGGDLEEHAAVAAHRIVDMLDAAVASRPPTVVRAVPIDAHVLDVTGETITISAGHDDDLAPGELLRVYRPGNALVEPVTGELLGHRETYLGDLEVTAVGAETSQGHPTRPVDLERGDTVQR